MDDLLFRTRVAVLWVAVVAAMLGSLLLYLFVPGALEDLLAGEMEGETLTDGMGYFFTAVGALPLVMAGVTLLVGDQVNRYLNLFAGTAFGLFGAFAFISHLVAGDFNGHILFVGLAGILAFLIAGLSLVRLRQKAPREPAQTVAELPRSREKATV